MLIKIDGKDYDWRGEYREPQSFETFLNSSGGLLTRGEKVITWVDKRAILHPIPVTHTFGSVVFEETGEERRGYNEWILWDYSARFITWKTDLDYKILRPVGIDDQS